MSKYKVEAMVGWKLEYSERTETLCSIFHLIRKDCFALGKARDGEMSPRYDLCLMPSKVLMWLVQSLSSVF